MPTSERDIMADNDAQLRHQNPISSDISKAVVPMWDSSDPERAPPPLPMNPSSPSLVSKSHTSSMIQSAHVALAEKAWETGYVTNPPPKRIEYSPERFMMKGVAHKRIKSLQPGLKDLSSPMERIGSVNGPRSPGKAPGWRGSTYTVKDVFIDSTSPEKESRKIRTGRFSERELMSSNEEKASEKLKSLRYEEKLTDSHKDLNKNLKKEEDSSRSNTPSPDHLENLSRDLAKTRISLRKPQQSILGENIPPQSATMLALQSMASKEEDTRLTNISNSSNALVRTPQTFDAISNQILSLTSIATNLQKEMAQLSRRSKDNATDLISLKEATNARDEDIRRSLRELVHNLSENGSRSSSNVQDSAGFYLNDKLHNYPMPRMKAFSLPRIPSPTGFASSLDRESIISPASYVADGVAIIALLEKVLREMGTREGQKHIMSKISEFLSRDESSTEKKVDDLIMLIKANISDSDSPSRYGGSVRLNRSRTLSLEPAPRLELEFDKSQSVPSSCAVALKSSTNNNKSSNEHEQASTIISDDTVNIIRTIKDSVTQGGGLTAEVKALVRELRGEVLGMGREITRKLDEVNEESTKVVASEKEHVSRIVKNGIEDWKTHVDHILREYRRQSTASIVSKTSVDHREVCKAVRDAIIEMDKSQSKSLEKEDILNAVRDAWECHKPEIKLQQFWPERDELLNCIKEGIQAFSPPNNTPVISGATREEVFEAVVKGLKCIPLPCVDTVANISREEILTAVRQCLEEFEFSLPSSQNESSDIGVTKNILLDAVKEGLKSFDFSSSIKSSLIDTNLYLTRHEILEAIQDGFKGLEATAGTKELVNGVDESQKDFCEISNVNLIDKSEMNTLIGQICEKFKNILDSTRTELEAVTREAKNEASTSSNATEKLLENTQDWFEKLRAEIEEYADKTSGNEIVNTIMGIKSSIDSLHAELERLMSNISSGSPTVVLAEIENLRDMFSASNFVDSEAIHSDFLTTLQDGLENIKDLITSSLSSPDFVVERTEILSAIKDGFDCAKEEIDISRRFEIDSGQMEILNEIKGGLNDMKETMSFSLIPTSSALDKDEIVNAIMEIKETISSSLIPSSSRIDTYEILKAINESLENFKENMSSSLVPTSSSSDNYEILKAINDGLDNIKETMFSSLQTNSPGPHNNEVLEAIKDVKETMSSSLVPTSSSSDNYEILKAINDGLDNIKETMFSSLQTNSPGPHNNEVLEAIKDVKETMSSSLVPTSSSSDNYAISNTINEGLQNIKDIISSSLITTSSVINKKEVSNIIKDSFDNVKDAMLSSLPTDSSRIYKDEILNAVNEIKDIVMSSFTSKNVESDRNLVLEAINDSLNNIKHTISSSLSTDSSGVQKDEILNAIKDVKEIMSSSSPTDSSRLDKDEILNAVKEMKDSLSSSLTPESLGLDKDLVFVAINDGFESIKDIMLSNLPTDNSSAQKDEIMNAIKDMKENISSSSPTDSSRLDKDEILNAVKEMKDSLSSSLTPESLGLDKDLVFVAINDGFESIKDIMLSNLPTDNSSAHKDEIMNAIKDMKENISSSFLTENLDLDRDLLLEAISDGFDHIKDSLSSINPTDNSGIFKDEILNAIKDFKETMLLSSTDSSGLFKDEVLDAIKDGVENVKDIIMSSVIPKSSGTEKDEISDIIRDGLDNILKTMSSSLMPANLDEDKSLVLAAINEGLDNIKENISSSLSNYSSGQYKDEILEEIKVGLENVKEAMSSSLVPGNIGFDQEFILQNINNSIDKMKETWSSSFSIDKEEILNAIKDVKDNVCSSIQPANSGLDKDVILLAITDSLEGFKETLSSSLVPGNPGLDRNEILNCITDGLENLRESISTSLLPKNSELDKDEISNAVKDGLESFKETMSTSLVPRNSGLDKDEILLTIADSLEGFKEKLSTSLAPENAGLNKDEILITIADGLDSFRETMSTSLVPRNSGLDKDEILLTITDSLEGFKETLSSSLVPDSPGLDKNEISNAVKDGLESFKEILSTSLAPENTGISKDEILITIMDGLERFKETMSTSLVPRNSELDKDEISNAVKDGLESFKETLSTSLAPENTGISKDEILITIMDGLERFKETMSTSLVPRNSELDKDEISNAVKDGLESFKEILSTSLSPENFGLDKNEISNAVKDGLESFKETLSTSLAPENTGISKDEILITIMDGLERFKETMSTSLVPRNSELDKDEISNAVKDGLESFKETLSTSLAPENTGISKDEILITIMDGLERFKETISTSLVPRNSGLDKDEILLTITDSLEGFKETLSSSLVPDSPGLDKNEISNAVKDGLESFKETLSTSLAPENTGISKDEILITIMDGLERFKETMSTSLVPRNSELDKDEISNAVKDGLESFKEILSSSLSPENFGLDKNEISNAVKDGLESFKETLSTSLAPENTGISKDEILITIMDGLERFKETMSTSLVPRNSELDKDEISNAVKDGLESFKETLSTSLVNYQGLGRDEILHTITHGLESFKQTMSSSLLSETSGFVKDENLLVIKDAIENLKDSISSKLTSVISESGIDGALQKLKESMDGMKEDLFTQQSLIDHFDKSDVLDTIKVGLSNISIEVEKVVNKPSELSEIGLSKETFGKLQIGLEDVRADLNRLQKTIQDERTTTELNSLVTSFDLLRRNDIENLESLVTDLCAKTIPGDLTLPPSEFNQVPLPKIDLTDLEDKLKNIQNSVTDLFLRDQISDQKSIKKEDLKSIENLLMNTKVKIEELDTEPSVTKEDFNALEFLIGETRDNLSNLTFHLENVSKKDDTKILEPIIRDALIGIEELKDLVVKNSGEVKKIDVFAIESTCLDIKNTIDQVLISEITSLASKDDVKDLEAQFKDFQGRIDKNTETNSSIFEERHLHIIEINETIQKFLEEFENSITSRLGEGITSIDTLRKLLEGFGQVLTRDSKITDEIKCLSEIIKDEIKKSTSLLVGSKVDINEKFQQNWDKLHEDFERKFFELFLKFDAAKLAAEGANKLSEEKTTRIEAALRGTEVATDDLKLLASNLNLSLTESFVTLDKNSSTVLHGVDATYNRLQEIHVETKSGNQQISDDMAKVLGKIEAIDNTLKEYGPKTSESMKDLVFVTNKQYDHSVSSLANVEKIITEKLPKLDIESSTPFLLPSAQPIEKYDDTCVHEKLDKLTDEMHIASKSFVQLDILEKIHQQVIKTAAEVSEYFTTQKKQSCIEYEENKRASEEINSIIEKKLTEKDNLDISVIDLRREEENLKKSILDLKAEQEGLNLQKTRLYSEVSSLETALRIRREELDAMEARAGNLERRIIESVIDHSRSLLITNKNKGREIMSRKRVPSNNGSTTSPTRSRASNMTKLAVDMVTGDNISAKKNPPGISRRILSLSQITNNLAPGILKRSHSVKASSGKQRKSSWGGTLSKDENLTGNSIQVRENEENSIRDIYANPGSASNEIVTEDETAGSLECRNIEMDDYSDAESTVVAEFRCRDTIKDVNDEESGSKEVDEEIIQ